MNLNKKKHQSIKNGSWKGKTIVSVSTIVEMVQRQHVLKGTTFILKANLLHFQVCCTVSLQLRE